jgi:hypothetical protein
MPFSVLNINQTNIQKETNMSTKSIRLNKQLRQDILNNIMDSYDAANPAPERPEMKKGTSIGELIKKAFFTKHKKVIEEVTNSSQALKDIIGIHKKSTYLDIKDEKGYWSSIYFTEDDLKDLDVPQALLRGCFINLEDPAQRTAAMNKAIEAKKKFEKTTLKEYKQVQKDYDLSRRNYASQIRTVLDGVNTSNQLLEVWPEVSKYLPTGVLEPSKIQLPSVNIATLNSALIK